MITTLIIAALAAIVLGGIWYAGRLVEFTDETFRSIADDEERK